MNATQRMKAMVEGKPVDRPGVSVWKHIYLEDRHPVDFVKRTIEIQEANDWDFIKVCYNGYLFPEAFGAQIQWSQDSNTFPTMLKHSVCHPKQWLDLRPASVTSGALRREIDATARIVDHFKGEVPVLPTIFSPLTAAQEMSCGWLNPWPIMQSIQHSPEELKAGLDVITETTIRFLEELCKVGIDGVFFATQLACHCRTTPSQHDEFGRTYDLSVLNSIQEKTWFNMIHIHGVDELFFEEIEDYPVQAFNWEDLRSNISLEQARKLTDKILVGGIDNITDMESLDRDGLKQLLKERITRAVQAAGKDRLVIAPGCVMPTHIPEYRFTVLKEAVEELF